MNYPIRFAQGDKSPSLCSGVQVPFTLFRGQGIFTLFRMLRAFHFVQEDKSPSLCSGGQGPFTSFRMIRALHFVEFGEAPKNNASGGSLSDGRNGVWGVLFLKVWLAVTAAMTLGSSRWLLKTNCGCDGFWG